MDEAIETTRTAVEHTMLTKFPKLRLDGSSATFGVASAEDLHPRLRTMSLYESVDESFTAYSCLRSDVVRQCMRCGMTSLPYFMAMLKSSKSIGQSGVPVVE